MAERRHPGAGPVAVLAVIALLALSACTSNPSRRAGSATSGTTAGVASTSSSVSQSRSTGRSAAGSSSRSDTASYSRALTSGRLFAASIPGGATHFASRPAEVYLPPAARTHPRERFPVLVLLHGTTDGPTAWVRKGAVRTTLDRFAAAHGGQAPVVVMPDVNGSNSADTECVRTTNGANVEQYLLSTVPAWIATHLPVSTDHRQWGIGGLSEGGTCALVLGLRGYPTFSFVADFSGLKRLTVGNTDNPGKTIATLFGGSRAAYNAHDPAVLLRARTYPLLDIWFECGASDRTVIKDQAGLVAAARPAVRAVHVTTVPGRHNWAVWRAALVTALPTFWADAT